MSLRAVAMALALGVSALTPRASAAESEPPPANGTPLALVSSKPVGALHEPESSGLGWKVLAGVVVVAALGAAARSRLRARRSEPSSMRVVRRLSIALRSELVVVEVEGQRMLLGVTPAGIQQLTSLEPSEDDGAVAERPRSSAVDERFTAMLERAERRPPERRPAVSEASLSARPDPSTVPGQARGLLRLGSR